MPTEVGDTRPSPPCWPISRIGKGDLALVCLPARTGDGAPYRRDTIESFPALEEIVGDDWRTRVLNELVPLEKPLFWWLDRAVWKRLPSLARPLERLEDTLSARSFSEPRRRSRLLSNRVLVALPAGPHSVRSLALEWAGYDTEFEPDLLWVPASDAAEWSVVEIEEWCRAADWTDLATVVRSSDRLIAVLGGDVYAAVPASEIAPLLAQAERLADEWGLRIIEGPARYAWPSESGWGVDSRPG